MNFDTFAYIPLIATAVLATVMCVLLAVVRIRNTARVSYILFLVLIIVVVGVLRVVLRPTLYPLMTLGAMCLLICVLIVPYAIMLCTFDPKKKEIKDKSSTTKEATPVVETIVQKLEPKQINLLDDCRSFIIKATEGYGEKDGVIAMLEFVAQKLMDATRSDGALGLLVDDFDEGITVKTFIGSFPPPYKLPSDMPHKPIRIETNLKHAQFGLHDNIFGEVAINGVPELINEPLKDSRIVQNEPEDFLKCGAYIFIPLKSGDTVFGLVALAKKLETGVYTEDEFNDAKLLGDFASSSVKTMFSVQDVMSHSEMAKEADIAAKIQASLIANKLPTLQTASVGAMFNAAEGVCGDYYDVIQARKDRIAFVMADVAGKGTKSMTVMIMIKAMLQLVVNTTQTAATILTWANRGLVAEPQSDHFASLALILYNPLIHKLQIAAGGSVPLLLFSKERQSIEKLPISSDPLGIEKTTTYKDIVVPVQAGDILLAYTDGVLENQNEKGKQYEFNSLINIVKANANLSGKDIANKIKQDIKVFSENARIHDDQSLMVVKFQ